MDALPPIYGLSQKGFQSLVLLPEVLLDFRSCLTVGWLHSRQARLENRFSIFKQSQEALGVSGTHLPVLVNEHLQHVLPSAQAKQPQQVGWIVAVPEVTALVHFLEVLQDLLLRPVGSLLLPCFVQSFSLGHPVVELGRVPVAVFPEDTVQV
jgi:hypothetical protein